MNPCKKCYCSSKKGPERSYVRVWRIAKEFLEEFECIWERIGNSNNCSVKTLELILLDSFIT